MVSMDVLKYTRWKKIASKSQGFQFFSTYIPLTTIVMLSCGTAFGAVCTVRDCTTTYQILPEEFWESVKYFQGDRSPYIYEKEHFGYAPGWLHHKGINKHHWEYWYDMINGKWTPLEMPFNYFVEMVCDRVGACRIYQKEHYTKESALQYYLSRGDRWAMHPETAKKLEDVLRDIADRGERSSLCGSEGASQTMETYKLLCNDQKSSSISKIFGKSLKQYFPGIGHSVIRASGRIPTQVNGFCLESYCLKA